MITPKEALLIIEQSGIKKNHVSKNTQICIQYLSEWLNDKRILDIQQLNRLESYLSKVKKIILD